MIECDLHVHSIRSTCGFHTLFEIIDIMREKGLGAFALTDHSPGLGTPRSHFSVLLRRIPPVVRGLRVFKGIEASVMSGDGDLDLPVFAGFPYEIILASLHPHDLFTESQGITTNTRAVVNAMKRHPGIKVITHPYNRTHPVDIDAVTDTACETGTALELNNSHLLLGKADRDVLARMLELAKEKGTLIMVNSDGHTYPEMGESELAIKAMEPFGIENFTIVNQTLESTLDFLGLEE